MLVILQFLFGGGLVYLLWKEIRRLLIKPPTHITFSYRKNPMPQVVVNWTPSASAGVTEQRLTVTNAGNVQPTDVLGSDVTTFAFVADEGVDVSVELVAVRNGVSSLPAVANGTVPFFSAPESPANLTLEFNV